MRTIVLLGLAALVPQALLVSPALAEGDAAAGEKAFVQCKSCHAFGKNGAGPDLTGVMGKKAGEVAGYSFSDALKNSGLTFDEATMKEWLTDPRKKVPGTKMFYAGVKDPKKLDDLIAYLKTK